MTGMSEALFAALGTIAPLSGGWWPLRTPDGASLPAGTYQRISSVPSGLTHGGGTDLMRRRYQLSVYSDRYLAGLEAARDVVAALNGVRETWDGWTVTASIADDAEDIDPDPRGLFRQRIDVLLASEAP